MRLALLSLLVLVGCQCSSPVDPCAGLTCNTPPPCFTGGACVAGRCQYQVEVGATCSDGDACTQGDVCGASGACTGTAIACQTPPASACVTAQTLRRFEAVGQCGGAGVCSYAPSEVPCSTSEVCQVDRCAWNDASLSGLTATPGNLGFSPSLTLFPMAVPAGTTSVALTATVSQPGRATVRINGAVTASGTPATVTLAGRVTTVPVRVDAESGASTTYTVVVTVLGTTAQQAYVKASNTGFADRFGYRVALSADGSTLAVGAIFESSNATGVNGNQANNAAPASGAVYVFTRSGSAWAQQAYLKASNTGAEDRFGESLALSADGHTLAVGAYAEASNATGVDGNQADNSAMRAGAAYVFTRSGNTWAQQAYLKASNTGAEDRFGESLALSADGRTLAVGAPYEASSATGVNGNQADNAAAFSGAVYVFARAGSAWAQQAYVKASNTGVDDAFGSSVALNADGNTLAVGATGVGDSAGAVYVFTRSATTWAQQMMLSASNSEANDGFGASLALSADGTILVAGAARENSGTGSNPADNSTSDAGAVYVFARSGTSWAEAAYLKASIPGTNDVFGVSVAVSADGSTVAVGATGESSSATGVNGNQADNSLLRAGAAYVFTRTGATWGQQAYVKASAPGASDFFGTSVALSADSTTLAVGAFLEDSSATGVDGDATDNGASDSGAAYVFTR
jgi:hypothetical protein